ncbi:MULTISPECIES: hypothetical protein [Maribacter]|uniref:hypothetical protein n=1 Tax=Maribacter TaxID=252356 RepID=UPI0017583F63|nr:hypothetical protein [Maribacter sp.]HDZ05740.1 hypothetical protein [Maribacter sp.]HEA80064.1 hypothetical protein [Maribacter sp.]
MKRFEKPFLVWTFNEETNLTSPNLIDIYGISNCSKILDTTEIHLGQTIFYRWTALDIFYN